MKFEINPELLFSRGEPEDPRLGEIARMPTLAEFEKSKWDAAIIGFADDRGIALNKGRVGAKEGPNSIRKWFYRLVPPSKTLDLADLGDMQMSGSIEADHAKAADVIAIALGHARRVVVLGGGHDWGYSPIAALMQGGRTGFVNFDAHLDVRASGLQHSGTSYWRALETGIRGEDAVWCGIQRTAASELHRAYVEAKGGKIFDAEEPLSELANALPDCEAFDVSLDLDVVSMSEAPGVSAPQATGLPAREVLNSLQQTLTSPKARTFGIYELCPPHDVNEMTARLAARYLWEAIASL